MNADAPVVTMTVYCSSCGCAYKLPARRCPECREVQFSLVPNTLHQGWLKRNGKSSGEVLDSLSQEVQNMTATKTARKPRPKKAASSVIDVPVSFGGVSIGDKTARLGVSVDRNDLTLAQADKNLCGRRLTGTVVAKPPGDNADQGALPGLEDDTTLQGVFDVKRFGVDESAISFGLTFAVKGLDVASLAHFAKRNGRFQVFEVEAIPDEANEEGSDEDKDNEDFGKDEE